MSRLENKIQNHLHYASELNAAQVDGKVVQITGLVIEATATTGTVGDICDVYLNAEKSVRAEIVGFRNKRILMMPLGETLGVSPGSRVRRNPLPLKVPVGDKLLGRILDGLGNPIDGKGPVQADEFRNVHNHPPNPLERRRIREPLVTGIRAIDGLITLGKGQRVGIFAGSGVGKSVLLGMISRYTDADINVIALIGERGREVREFIERDLGEEGLKRSVVIVATSDQAATMRIKGAFIATTIAEYFRDKGKNVLLLMDSLTRVAMAQREIGLAVGEPPATKGYTPSVFAMMPRLLERAGNSSNGTITGLYTVLVEGDDLDEPISDSARSILDGHIVLSRRIATTGHYPAIDALGSISRLRTEVTDDHQKRLTRKMLDLLAAYHEAEDLINIGAYAGGSNARIDEAIKRIENMRQFLRQNVEEPSEYAQTMQFMDNVLSRKD